MAVRAGGQVHRQRPEGLELPRTARGEVSAAVPDSDQRRERRAEAVSGMSMLMADLKVPQVTIKKIDKLGRNAVDSNEVWFVDLPVDASDLVGEEGKGFQQILSSVNSERILLAAEGVGMGRWCLERAVAYAGRASGLRSHHREEPVDPAPARRVLHAAAGGSARRAGGRCRPTTTAPRRARSVAWPTPRSTSRPRPPSQTADVAMQVHGGYSFATEYHIGRHWIELRPHSHRAHQQPDGAQLHRREGPRAREELLMSPTARGVGR